MTLNIVRADNSDAENQAAAWFARWRSGQMIEADFEAIEAWFNSEPGNRQAFDDIAAIWEDIEPVRRDPAVMALREKAKRGARRGHTMRLMRQAAAVLMIATVGFAFARYATDLFGAAPDRYVTRVGQTSTMRLADGSKVTLDTDSELKVWRRRLGDRRLELVRGRAFFDVASDPSRPFVVRTDQGSVTALGTSFDVRKEPRGLKVTLVEGKVRIKPPVGVAKGEQVEMTAGQEYIGGADSWRVTHDNTPYEVSWVTGDLVFNEEPLDVIVKEMNRYTRRKIIIGDAAVGERKLSAVLKIGETETLLTSVQMLGIAKVQAVRGQDIVLVAAK
jgi:transmembrane sensor